MTVISPLHAHQGAGETHSRPPEVLGKIAGPHGVQGWMKVHSHTRPPEQILDYERWMLAARADADVWRPVRVACARRQPGKLLAKLAGVDDRNGAQRLAGQWIAIHPSQLAALPEGEYYWSDLAGLAVVNQDGVELGVVDHLVETGANDVLVVRRAGAGDESRAFVERLLPWTPDVVTEVDLAGGHMRVRWDADE